MRVRMLLNNQQSHSQGGRSEIESVTQQSTVSLSGWQVQEWECKSAFNCLIVRVKALKVIVLLNNHLSHCQSRRFKIEIVTQKVTVSLSGWHVWEWENHSTINCLTVQVVGLRVRVSLNNQHSYCKGSMSESEIVTQQITVSLLGWHIWEWDCHSTINSITVRVTGLRVRVSSNNHRIET